jgi:DNA-binding NarL/FixJ family response regulator
VLFLAVSRVAAGERFVDPTLAESWPSNQHRARPATIPAEVLSPREWQVLA